MNRTPTILLAGLLITALAACTGSTGGLGSVPTPVSTPSASAEPSSPDLTPAPSGSPGASSAPSVEPTSGPSDDPGASATPGAPTATMIVRSYFVLGGEPGTAGLVPVLRIVPKSAAVATAAMTALLNGPDPESTRERTITSAIPAGSRLLGVSIKSGVATVDLSTEFDSGGGSASMQYRLAQVVYTLTQFSTVRSVVFQIEGETVTVFGSEGIVLDGPVGRADYVQQLPTMFVDRPAFGAACRTRGRCRATPMSSRRRSALRSLTPPGNRSWTSRSWPRVGPVAVARSPCHLRTRSARRSGGPSAFMTRRPRTGRPRTPATTRSG